VRKVLLIVLAGLITSKLFCGSFVPPELTFRSVGFDLESSARGADSKRSLSERDRIAAAGRAPK
jgi:hypothetical protein